jgi:hypothetical protein
MAGRCENGQTDGEYQNGCRDRGVYLLSHEV